MQTKKGGCILINSKEKKIALIYRPYLKDYSFPKGHIEKGEEVIDCAIRETIEETGHSIKLIKSEPIFIDKYMASNEESVEVYYYLAEDIGEYTGEIKEEDKEICEWMPFEEVESILTYEDLKEMWRAALPMIKEQFENNQ